MDILISGAGVAGPTLAYWLRHYGHAVTMVERAQHLRTGGYIIDFWGAGYEVADRMGLIPKVSDNSYQVQEIRFVGKNGKRVAGFPVRSMSRLLNGRFTSLPRGDLAAAIFDKSEGEVETLFGDQIEEIDTQGAKLRVRFQCTSQRTFDLVIGAGGLHSRVRSLLFGPEERFARYLGYKVAAFEAVNYPMREELAYVSYGQPGIQASRFSLRNGNTLVLFVMADDDPQIPSTSADQRAYLHKRFGKAGWECPMMLSALEQHEDIYFDRVSQIEMPAWSKGRVALIGDAAFCPSLLAGEGTSLAMTAAYVLAGELHHARGNAADAFCRYEERLRPLLTRKQKAARQFAQSFAPKTQFGLLMRNLITNMIGLPGIARFAIGASLRDDFPLPNYS